MQCTERKIIPISLCEEALMAPQIDHKIRPYTDKLRQSEWKKRPPHTDKSRQSDCRTISPILSVHMKLAKSYQGSNMTDNEYDKGNSNILIDNSCLIRKVWKILSLKLRNHLLFSNWKVCRMPTEQNPNCWDKWQIKILKARSFLWAKIMAISSKPCRPRK